MLFLFFLGCFTHKASLSGVVDSISDDLCIIEVASGDIITVESKFCRHVKEGERVLFYIDRIN